MSIRDDMTARPFDHVPVLRMLSQPDGSVISAPVAHWAQVVPGFSYSVFDSRTGRHFETDDPTDEINRVLEQKIQRAEAIEAARLAQLNEEQTNDTP